ncbi:hypothetical protein [Puia dinghuensis]|nr:hypothetical protein [Puia dinghuensis]
MEQMDTFKAEEGQAKESTVMVFITAFLYFAAILSFAYLFTMS